jgi:hypothetical protein
VKRARCKIQTELVLGLLVIAGSACKAKEEQLFEKVYRCTSDDQCGHGPSGAPMICFEGRLDGPSRGFCAESCDPRLPPADASRICVAMGALLSRCHPHASDDDRADCPPGLNCFRTNLLASEGVCMDVPVCGPNNPCKDPYYASCPADSISGDVAAFLQLDHLNCSHRGCRATGQNSACMNGEGCLGNTYRTDAADICVPFCDANLRCPPNFSCLRATSGPAAPNLCNPGIVGNRCEGQSCVIGTCDDTGAGFSVCAIPCGTDQDCKVLDNLVVSFSCVDSGGARHCVTTLPFHGSNCLTDEDCRRDLGEACFFQGVTGATFPGGTAGECRLRCKADGTCDPRGGLPHTCLGPAGGCFPGDVGATCTLQSECLSGLMCQDVPSDRGGVDAAETTRICTVPCDVEAAGELAADAQCNAFGSIHGGIYCGAGFCREPIRKVGEPCERSAQCASTRCDTVDHVCLATGAGTTP